MNTDRKNKLVVFIVTSFWAYGELMIAIGFALRLRKAGYRIHFFLPGSHKEIIKSYNIQYTVLIPKSRNINRVLFADFENNYTPDFIILSDFMNYHFCERHYGLLNEDLNIFSGRIGAFDIFDWENAGKPMDTYGFKSSYGEVFDLERFDFRLLPCPITDSAVIEKRKKHYYPLIDHYLDYNENIKKEKRKKLNLPEDKKIIVYTTAKWQDTYKAYENVTAFVEASNQLLGLIIDNLSKKHIVIHIGTEPLENAGTNGGYRYFTQMAPETFNEYLQACDLFLSRNYTSTTMAKAILAGIPTVLLKNSYYFKSEEKKEKILEKLNQPKEVESIIQSLAYSYPYYMYPVGWYKFLKPLVSDNLYGKTFVEVEQYDLRGCIDAVENALTGNSAIIAQNIILYKSKMERLDTPIEIMEKVSLNQGLVWR